MKIASVLGLILVITACNRMYSYYPDGTVVEYRSGEYPAQDFSPRQRVDGGYRIHSPIDSVSVVFPKTGWRRVDHTYPGGGYVVEPSTGTSFRYDSIRFGSKREDFLHFHWYVREHRWVERWPGTNLSYENQKEFLSEWLQRTLVKREINHPDRLSVVLPILSADSLKSQLCPLHLGDQILSTPVQTEEVERHNFSHVTVPTYIIFGGQRRQFETEVWLSYFRFVPKFEQWQFFVAFSHIPSNLSPDQKKDMRELFGKTLRSLSIDPFNG